MPANPLHSPEALPSDVFSCQQKFDHKDKQVWLATGSKSIRYGELKARINAIAGLVEHYQLGIGDRVVVSSCDDTEVALLFVALICNGITVVNLDPDTGPERAGALIEKAEPSLMILDRAIAARWPLGSKKDRLVEIVADTGSTGLAGRLLGRTPVKREGLHGLLDNLPPATPPEAIPDHTLAYILFTSGTTSQPKGVSISHRALFAHLNTLSQRFGYDQNSRILNTLMLSHADGMIQGPVIAFYNHATLHRPFPFEITSLEPLLDAVYQLRITHMIAVPTMLSLIMRLGLDQRDAFQGGDFRLLISCGAQLEEQLWTAVEDTFQVPLVNVYGLTETVVGGCFSGPDEVSRAPGSIGQPVDCELKLIDRDGRKTVKGEPGELLIRGDLLMSGYFGDPELTENTIKEGWLHTGDIAQQDAQGRYWIRGREKSIIIRGGLNIHPEEITEVLQRHPSVREAVTFGVSDPVWGETVAALVAGEEGLDPEGLTSFCAQQLEPRKVPGRITVVKELPRGRSGKVMLDAAQELLHQAGSTPQLKSGKDIEERVLATASRCFRMEASKLALASSPKDIPGWDSLAHLELVVALEQEFDVKFTARDIMALDRLDKALELVQ